MRRLSGVMVRSMLMLMLVAACGGAGDSSGSAATSTVVSTTSLPRATSSTQATTTTAAPTPASDTTAVALPSGPIPCGPVQTEDGPIETQVVEGATDCTEALAVLGDLLGGGSANVTGDFQTGWTVAGWTCGVETLPSGALVYTCRAPAGAAPAVISTIAVDEP